MRMTGHSSRIHRGLERAPGKADNWVERAGGLPSYIERVAKHIAADSGYPVSRAIASAVSQVKKWAAQGNPQAIRAVAQWEALKAKNKARSRTDLSTPGPAYTVRPWAPYGAVFDLAISSHGWVPNNPVTALKWRKGHWTPPGGKAISAAEIRTRLGAKSNAEAIKMMTSDPRAMNKVINRTVQRRAVRATPRKPDRDRLNIDGQQQRGRGTVRPIEDVGVGDVIEDTQGRRLAVDRVSRADRTDSTGDRYSVLEVYGTSDDGTRRSIEADPGERFNVVGAADRGSFTTPGAAGRLRGPRGGPAQRGGPAAARVVDGAGGRHVLEERGGRYRSRDTQGTNTYPWTTRARAEADRAHALTQWPDQNPPGRGPSGPSGTRPGPGKPPRTPEQQRARSDAAYADRAAQINRRQDQESGQRARERIEADRAARAAGEGTGKWEVEAFTNEGGQRLYRLRDPLGRTAGEGAYRRKSQAQAAASTANASLGPQRSAVANRPPRRQALTGATPPPAPSSPPAPTRAPSSTPAAPGSATTPAGRQTIRAQQRERDQQVNSRAKAQRARAETDPEVHDTIPEAVKAAAEANRAAGLPEPNPAELHAAQQAYRQARRHHYDAIVVATMNHPRSAAERREIIQAVPRAARRLEAAQREHAAKAAKPMAADTTHSTTRGGIAAAKKRHANDGRPVYMVAAPEGGVRLTTTKPADSQRYATYTGGKDWGQHSPTGGVFPRTQAPVLADLRGPKPRKKPQSATKTPARRTVDARKKEAAKTAKRLPQLKPTKRRESAAEFAEKAENVLQGTGTPTDPRIRAEGAYWIVEARNRQGNLMRARLLSDPGGFSDAEEAEWIKDLEKMGTAKGGRMQTARERAMKVAEDFGRIAKSEQERRRKELRERKKRAEKAQSIADGLFEMPKPRKSSAKRDPKPYQPTGFQPGAPVTFTVNGQQMRGQAWSIGPRGEAFAVGPDRVLYQVNPRTNTAQVVPSPAQQEAEIKRVRASVAPTRAPSPAAPTRAPAGRAQSYADVRSRVNRALRDGSIERARTAISSSPGRDLRGDIEEHWGNLAILEVLKDATGREDAVNRLMRTAQGYDTDKHRARALALAQAALSASSGGDDRDETRQIQRVIDMLEDKQRSVATWPDHNAKAALGEGNVWEAARQLSIAIRDNRATLGSDPLTRSIYEDLRTAARSEWNLGLTVDRFINSARTDLTRGAPESAVARIDWLISALPSDHPRIGELERLTRLWEGGS